MRMLSVVALTVLFLTTNAFAGVLKDENEIKAFTESLMQQVAKGDLDSAFNAMKPYVNLSPTEIDSAAMQSKAQREQYGQRYGAANGYEFIDTKKMGQSLLRVRYIEKTKLHALPWLFYFYKTEQGWTLNGFNWNDRFGDLFN